MKKPLFKLIAHSAFLTVCIAGIATYAQAEEIDLASDTIVLGESIYVPECFEANADGCSKHRIQVNLKKENGDALGTFCFLRVIRFDDCPDNTVPFGAVATDPGSHWKVNMDQETYCTSIPAWATLTRLKSKQLPTPKRKIPAVYKDY